MPNPRNESLKIRPEEKCKHSGETLDKEILMKFIVLDLACDLMSFDFEWGDYSLFTDHIYNEHHLCASHGLGMVG